MRLRRGDLAGDAKLLDLAESLVKSARDRQQLKDLAYAIWPRLRIYEGDTCLRFIPTGQSAEGWFYVDLMP